MSENPYRLPEMKWITLGGKKFARCEHCQLRLSSMSPQSRPTDAAIAEESKAIAKRYTQHLIDEHPEKVPPILRKET